MIAIFCWAFCMILSSIVVFLVFAPIRLVLMEISIKKNTDYNDKRIELWLTILAFIASIILYNIIW